MIKALRHPGILRLWFGQAFSSAFIVLIPVIVSFFRPVPISLLWAMALTLSGLSAFFDPATHAITAGYHLVRARPGMSYVFFAKCMTAGT